MGWRNIPAFSIAVLEFTIGLFNTVKKQHRTNTTAGIQSSLHTTTYGEPAIFSVLQRSQRPGIPLIGDGLEDLGGLGGCLERTKG